MGNLEILACVSSCSHHIRHCSLQGPSTTLQTILRTQSPTLTLPLAEILSLLGKKWKNSSTAGEGYWQIQGMWDFNTGIKSILLEKLQPKVFLSMIDRNQSCLWIKLGPGLHQRHYSRGSQQWHQRVPTWISERSSPTGSRLPCDKPP